MTAHFGDSRFATSLLPFQGEKVADRPDEGVIRWFLDDQIVHGDS